MLYLLQRNLPEVENDHDFSEIIVAKTQKKKCTYYKICPCHIQTRKINMVFNVQAECRIQLYIIFLK